jgi:hypothetical protein
VKLVGSRLGGPEVCEILATMLVIGDVSGTMRRDRVCTMPCAALLVLSMDLTMVNMMKLQSVLCRVLVGTDVAVVSGPTRSAYGCHRIKYYITKYYKTTSSSSSSTCFDWARRNGGLAVGDALGLYLATTTRG